MLFSDFGADVLRVDQPLKTPARDNHKNTIWNFERLMQVGNRTFNRNKKSIVLNLKSPDAREIFYKLAKSADVIIEGFRPGVVSRLGIDYENIKAINPKIIYCSLSGYGQSGPYADLPGHDVTYIAMAGALDMIGESNKAPVIPMNFIADWAGAALHATIGILIALLARVETGQGQFIDIAYTDGVASLVSPFAFDQLNYGVDYVRGGTPLNGGFPGYNVYQTKGKKYIAIGCFEPWFWENLCHFIGRDDYIPHQFAEGEKREEIFEYMRQFFLSKDREEWFNLMSDRKIPVGKVYSLSEAFSDSHSVHRHMLREFTLPDGKKEKTVGISIKMSKTPGFIRHLAPVPGQDTENVLLGLGYSSETIRNLVSQNIVSAQSSYPEVELKGDLSS